MQDADELTLLEKMKIVIDHMDLLEFDSYEQGFIKGMETIIIAIEEDGKQGEPLEKFLTGRQIAFATALYEKYEEQLEE